MLVLLLASNGAHAQIVRPRYQVNAPTAWASFSTALQQAFTVTDGSTGSVWQFGSATTYGGALEKVLANGIAVGVRGATAMVPLTYAGPVTSSDADARVSQLFGTLRLANGQGFHTVLELSAGATLYSEFRTRATSLKLPPANVDTDFSFAFGYGFGYAFSPRMSIDVVQDVTTAVHQKTGLSPSAESTTRIHGTRLTGRIGLGGRR